MTVLVLATFSLKTEGGIFISLIDFSVPGSAMSEGIFLQKTVLQVFLQSDVSVFFHLLLSMQFAVYLLLFSRMESQ